MYSQLTAASHCRGPSSSPLQCGGMREEKKMCGLLCWESASSTVIAEACGTIDESSHRRTCLAPFKRCRFRCSPGNQTGGVNRLEVMSGARRWELLFREKIWRSASGKTRQMADAGAEGDGRKNSHRGPTPLRFVFSARRRRDTKGPVDFYSAISRIAVTTPRGLLRVKLNNAL